MLSRGRKPQNERTPYDVFKIGPGQSVRFICMTTTWVDLMVHYTGKGSKVCPETDACSSCLSGNAQIFVGYVLGVRDADGKRYLFPLTGLAAGALMRMEWRSQSLVGAKIQLRRKGGSKRSPVDATIFGWTSNFRFVPMDALEHAVRTLYKLHGKQFETEGGTLPHRKPGHELAEEAAKRVANIFPSMKEKLEGLPD